MSQVELDPDARAEAVAAVKERYRIGCVAAQDVYDAEIARLWNEHAQGMDEIRERFGDE